MTKFDLHLHTDSSDGSDTPESLIEKVRESNVKIFAVTDHDTIDGALKISKLIPADFKFIFGIELTCKINDIKCRILGYGINPTYKGLLELIEYGKVLRREKLETRIKYLKDTFDIELTQSELEWLYSRKSVVKTHFANILVSRGLAKDNLSAMAKYLDGCKTGDTRFDGEKAIKIIAQAGGISVWAHPLGGEGEKHLGKNEFLQKLAVMQKCGIQGLECYYSRYNLDEIEFLLECAKNNNLLITGGSDYHGSNKTVELGKINTDGISVDSVSIQEFLSKFI